MALSRLSNMEGIRDSFTDQPTALQQIYERQRQEELDELEQYKAESERMKASEYATAGQFERKSTMSAQDYLKGGPPMPPPNSPPDVKIAAARERIAYLWQSPYEEHVNKATQMMQQIPTLIATGKGGTGTLEEDSIKAQNDYYGSQAIKNVTGGADSIPSLKDTLGNTEKIEEQGMEAIKSLPGVTLNEDGGVTNINPASLQAALVDYTTIVNENKNVQAGDAAIRNDYMMVEYNPPGITFGDLQGVMVPKRFAEKFTMMRREQGHTMTSSNQVAAAYLYSLDAIDREEFEKVLK